MKYLVLLLILVLSACRRELVTTPLVPIVVAVVDSANTKTASPSVPTAGPKMVVVAGKKIKLKKGATLVIQTGQENTATTIGKAKNSVLATGAGATATDSHKAEYKANGGVAVGQQASATGSSQTKEAGWPWYVWTALAGGLLYGLYRVKAKLGF